MPPIRHTHPVSSLFQTAPARMMNLRASSGALAFAIAGAFAIAFAPGASAQKQPMTSLPEITIRQAPVPLLNDAGADATELAKAGAQAFAENEWPRARDIYTKIVQANPDNALALSNLARAEFQLKNFDASRAHLEKSVELNPGLAESWVTLGLIYYRDGSLDLATSALTRALHLDPDHAPAHRYLAVVIRQRGWVTGAELQLQRAIELNPKDAEAHFNLALMYLERTDPAVELARRHYYRALDLGAAPDELIAKKLGDNSVEQ